MQCFTHPDISYIYVLFPNSIQMNYKNKQLYFCWLLSDMQLLLIFDKSIILFDCDRSIEERFDVINLIITFLT